MAWFTPYDHWLTITVVSTMQPYFSLTYTRAIERIVGTAVGGAIAAVVGLVCTTPLSIAAAMFPLAVGALAIRSVSFGLFMMALTPLVVLLVESGTPGASEWVIALSRAVLTATGGIIAVAANFLLWPSWEPDLVGPEVKRAIAAHGRYADAEYSVLLGEAPDTRPAARSAAGVASNALEALITRALLQPGGGKRDRLEAAMVVDAALRRFAGRLVSLQHDPTLVANLPREMLRGWRDWMREATQRLASGRSDLPPRPTGPETDAMRHIARQMELMAGVMVRLAD